jgi:hypothetical protein
VCTNPSCSVTVFLGLTQKHHQTHHIGITSMAEQQATQVEAIPQTLSHLLQLNVECVDLLGQWVWLCGQSGSRFKTFARQA